MQKFFLFFVKKLLTKFLSHSIISNVSGTRQNTKEYARVAQLVEPALEEVSDQIIKTQSVENISYQADNQYTTVMLLNAVENALEKAEIDGTVEE